MLKLKPETWVAVALLALIVSVGITRLAGSGSLQDFLAGLFLGLALALDVGYLIMFNRAR